MAVKSTTQMTKAELIEVIGEGHKVEILDKKDIWYQIKWKENTAFVRETNLQELR